MSEDTKNRLREFLSRDILYRDPSTLRDDEDLLASLDSMSIMQLVSFIEDEFGITLDYGEVAAKNLRTLAHIDRLVEAKMAGD
jgi:acyl carrier protein